MSNKITKREMASALKKCSLWSGCHMSVEEICKSYSWQELKDQYDEMDECVSEYYG